MTQVCEHKQDHYLDSKMKHGMGKETKCTMRVCVDCNEQTQECNYMLNHIDWSEAIEEEDTWRNCQGPQ
jgi:hypothetical protein